MTFLFIVNEMEELAIIVITGYRRIIVTLSLIKIMYFHIALQDPSKMYSSSIL